MPGIFDFMRRMVEGKPVFESEVDPDSPKVPESSAPVENKSAIDKGDEHSFPVVYVKHVTPHLNGARMQIYGQIVNMWSEEIMLDKIRLLDTVRELDHSLRGREEREFLLYDGPRPLRQIYEAQLDYKTQHEGDYFRAIHDVKFDYHADDKTYSVDELRLRMPIRDIYG